MNSSALFDVFLAIPLLWSVYRGFCKGFIIELASLIGLVLGIYGGLKFSGFASEILTRDFGLTSNYLPLISFALTFIVIVLAVYLLAKLIETIVNIASLKLMNKAAGAVFGFLKTAVILFILIFILDAVNKKSNCLPGELRQQSFFFKAFDKIPLDKSFLERFFPIDEKDEVIYA